MQQHGMPFQRQYNIGLVLFARQSPGCCNFVHTTVDGITPSTSMLFLTQLLSEIRTTLLAEQAATTKKL